MNDDKPVTQGRDDKPAGESHEWGDEVRREIEALHAKLDKLIRETITPTLAEAADGAEYYARRASATVQERPLLSLMFVAAVGWCMGHRNACR